MSSNEKFEKMKSVFDTGREYGMSQPMFFGQGNGLFDTINRPFPHVWDLFRQAVAQNWSDDEFDFMPCMKEFQEGGDAADVMIETIMTQHSLDSVVGNTLLPLLAPFITNSEVQALTTFNCYMECLTPDHEVYIKDKGWVKINEVSEGEEVLQYSPENESVSFVKIQKTIENDYEGMLYEFKSRNYHQITTENHRMVVKSIYKDVGEHKKDIPYFTTSKELLPHGHIGMIISGNKVGTKSNLTDWDKFWIAFQANGCHPKDPRYTGERSGELPVRFSFKRDDKKENLTKILDSLGIKYNAIDSKSKRGYTNFYIGVPMDKFIHEGRKEFGWVDVTDVDSNWCREFIHELWKWDGCKREKSTKKGKCILTYVNTNKEACEKIQLIAHLANMRVKWASYSYDAKNGRRTCYQLNITDTNYTVGNGIVKSEIPYKGKVYCITVPSGAFLTRLGTVVSVTGNCIHSASYSEIIRQAFTYPEQVLKDTAERQEVVERISKVAECLAELKEAGLKYELGEWDKEKCFPILYKGIVSLLLGERLQFIASFAITFALGEAGMFIPIANCVRKICSDEIQIHALADLFMLEELRKDPEWKKYENNEQFQAEILELVNEVIGSEMEWTEYLFRDGRTVTGISEVLIKDWVNFNGDIVKEALGFEKTSGIVENPLPWITSWLTLNKLQQANQETDSLAYKMGAIDDDSESMDFDF